MDSNGSHLTHSRDCPQRGMMRQKVHCRSKAEMSIVPKSGSRHALLLATMHASCTCRASSPSSISAFLQCGIGTSSRRPFTRRILPGAAALSIQLAQTSQNDYDGSSSNNNERSIDDYVLNVHGGKYRFEDPSLVGSAAGRDFAESLYSSSSDAAAAAEAERVRQEEALAAQYDKWPNWAKRAVDNSQRMLACTSTLQVPESGEVATVTMQNQYRTWEPYYVRVVRADDEVGVQCPYQIVSKIHGKLAPYGGVDIYSDCTNVEIRYTGGSAVAEGEDWFLVACTEEEQWYYRLVVS